MSFALGNKVDASKVFIERKTNVTGRWDPFYFRPELVDLENQVAKRTSHRLRDFVCGMAGGATPSTKDADTHYTEGENGVPFIRVQNLSTSGKLALDDCKYITRSTHEGLLKRSQLSGGELLVKITGVGRMAVASVVPEGFEGNINQHMVAIRTDDIATSETLAAFLNLDTAERLASRRSTGGTRPALDHPALLSIPIVFDPRIPELMMAAIDQHQKQTEKAKALLESIDDILLGELGIHREPEPLNTLKSRIFRRAHSDISGGRLDPIANQEKRRLLEEAIHSAQYPVVAFRKLIDASKTTVREIPDGENYVGLENIDSSTGEYFATSEKESIGTAIQFSPRQILFPKLRPYLNKTHLATFTGVCSTEFHVFDAHGASAEYLTNFLRSRSIVGITSLLMTGNTLPRLQTSDIERLPIPVPPPEVQKRICKKVNVIRDKSRQFREEARADLEKAKTEIEAMILGKETSE